MERSKLGLTPLAMNQKLSKKKKNGESRVYDSNYRSIIGSLLYLSSTRLDLMFSIVYFQGLCILQIKFILVLPRELLNISKEHLNMAYGI